MTLPVRQIPKTCLAVLALLLAAPGFVGTAAAAVDDAGPLTFHSSGAAASQLASSWSTHYPLQQTTAPTALTMTDSWGALGPTATPLARTSVSVLTEVRDSATGQLIRDLNIDRTALRNLFAGDTAAARSELAVLNPSHQLPAAIRGYAVSDGTANAIADYTGLPVATVEATPTHFSTASGLLAALSTLGSTSATGAVGFALTGPARASGLPEAALQANSGQWLLPSPTAVATGAYPLSGTVTATASGPLAQRFLAFAATAGQSLLPSGLIPLPPQLRQRLQAAAAALAPAVSAPPPVPAKAAVASAGSSAEPVPDAGAPVTEATSLQPVPQPRQSAAQHPAAPLVAPSPMLPVGSPTADQAALSGPVAVLTGSSFAGRQLPYQFGGIGPVGQVPAPLLAPAESTAPQQSRRVPLAATSQTLPSYNVMPGLLAGLIVGIGLVWSIRYVRPGRLEQLPPAHSSRSRSLPRRHHAANVKLPQVPLVPPCLTAPTTSSPTSLPARDGLQLIVELVDRSTAAR